MGMGVVMVVVMAVMMGGMVAWGAVAVVRSRLRGRRDKKPG